MIGVLLASARDGQRRPRLSDALDLAFGGLRIRIRAILAGQFDPSFTDALAVYSIAAPVMWMIILLALASGSAYNMVRFATATPVFPGMYVLILAPLILLTLTIVPLVLAWRRKRAAAAIVAFLPAAVLTGLALMPSAMTFTAFGGADSLLMVVLVVALAISPGPRRGAELMRGRTWIVVCAAGLAASVPLYAISLRWMLAGARAPIFAGVAFAAAAGFVLTLPRAVAVRLLWLMAGPVYLTGISIAEAYGSSALIRDSFEIVYLPAFALTVLTGALGWLGSPGAVSGRRISFRRRDCLEVLLDLVQAGRASGRDRRPGPRTSRRPGDAAGSGTGRRRSPPSPRRPPARA